MDRLLPCARSAGQSHHRQKHRSVLRTRHNGQVLPMGAHSALQQTRHFVLRNTHQVLCL